MLKFLIEIKFVSKSAVVIVFDVAVNVPKKFQSEARNLTAFMTLTRKEFVKARSVNVSVSRSILMRDYEINGDSYIKLTFSKIIYERFTLLKTIYDSVLLSMKMLIFENSKDENVTVFKENKTALFCLPGS